MRVPFAYLSVILIWSTTPLAIKWSGVGPTYVFGVASRMAIGAVCVWLAMWIRREPMRFNRRALSAYFGAAIHIYGAMMVLYWGAQFIPSGWLSVIFGLTPLLTALLAAVWLHERSLSPLRLLSYGLGLWGLWVIFGNARLLGAQAIWGVMGALTASFLQAASTVWIKRVNAGLPALTLVGGALMLSLPAYLLSWWVLDGSWPPRLNRNSLLSIGYLGLIATPLGFAFYFFVLKHMSATRVSLITLVTPVLALLLGHWANGEEISQQVILGAALILSALTLHQLADRPRKKRLVR